MTVAEDIDPLLLAALQREGLDTVAGAFACEIGEDLTKPGLGRRRRTRLTLTDEAGRKHEVYLKRYGPEPLLTRLRRAVFGGASPGEREVANIRAARAAGVATMSQLMCGAEAGRSYVVVSAVDGDALERCAEALLDRCDEEAQAPDELTRKLVELVRSLHGAGLVHRDLYASHVFLDEGAAGPKLYLIDLARAFTPRWRRFRWRVKDLAQLKYSMPSRWVDQCWETFLGGYLHGDAGRGVRRRWGRAIDRKVSAMRRRQWKKPPPPESPKR